MSRMRLLGRAPALPAELEFLGLSQTSGLLQCSEARAPQLLLSALRRARELQASSQHQLTIRPVDSTTSAPVSCRSARSGRTATVSRVWTSTTYPVPPTGAKAASQRSPS